jgi:hypothetical protein
MPEDKSSDRLSAAEEQFRDKIQNSYELEPEFVSALCAMYRETVEPLLADAGAATKRTRAASSKSATKKPRKKSAYNVFVREMMKTTGIKDLDHKQKMGAIAKMWKDLDAGARDQYTDMAKEENDVTPTEE